MTNALVMAGGQSERMRATHGPRHKSLVSVLGMTLLERNVFTLLTAGVRDLHVAIGRGEDELQQFLESRLRPLVAARQAKLHCLVEDRPLGTIGIASRFADQSEPLLVINVDNLTNLDLNEFVRYHVESGAAMTIATHEHPFRIPFGELVMQEGFVTAYLEKSARRIRISSGTYVLGQPACRLIPREAPMDAPELFRILREKGYPIAGFRHDAQWIDVNDGAAVAEAEKMILKNPTSFEPCSVFRTNSGETGD